jgi:hypothetical protein
MSLRTITSKNRRTKFGMFSTEAKAQEELSRRQKAFVFSEGTKFLTKKLQRTKDKPSWLAYALSPK